MIDNDIKVGSVWVNALGKTLTVDYIGKKQIMYTWSDGKESTTNFRNFKAFYKPFLNVYEPYKEDSGLKLEVGKCYWTRNAKVSNPVFLMDGHYYAYIDNDTRRYDQNGKSIDSDYDLVEEYVEEVTLPDRLKLEVDKFYKTRDGRKVGPMRAWGTSDTFLSSEGTLWYSNGEFYPGMPSEHDIVAEWVDNDREQYMIEVLQAFLNGKQVECTLKGLNNWGIIKTPIWNWDNFDYRVYQGVKDSINWDHVSPEYICHVRNKDGSAFLCSNNPVRDSKTWTNTGYYINAYAFASFKRGKVDWEDSLVFRPGYEP